MKRDLGKVLDIRFKVLGREKKGVWTFGHSDGRTVGQSNKRGQVLIENVVFLVLNLLFLSILILFLLKQGSSAVLMEETYSKQIALLIDSAKPGMLMQLNMEKAIDIAQEKGYPIENIVSINGQYVTVKLSEKGGQEYHFFNKIRVGNYPNVVDGQYNGMYFLTFSAERGTEEPVS